MAKSVCDPFQSFKMILPDPGCGQNRHCKRRFRATALPPLLCHGPAFLAIAAMRLRPANEHLLALLVDNSYMCEQVTMTTWDPNNAPLPLRTLARLPMPVRILTVIWLGISLVFYIGAPDSYSNLPTPVSLAISVPMLIVAICLPMFIFWRGCLTILTTVRSVKEGIEFTPKTPKGFAPTIGGIGALNIYMAAYMLTAVWLASLTKSYGLSIALSCVLAVGLGYCLIQRKPHPTDSRILLIGALCITILFGSILATVAMPPT